MKQSSFLTVLKRELHRMLSRRIYFVACIILPLFSLLFMATIFGNGQMENIPIGVVDADCSSISRDIIRKLDTSPGLRIVQLYSNESEAQKEMKEKSIYGYLCIPSNYELKVMTGNNPTLVYYYHDALLSVGGEVYGTMERLLKGVSIEPIVTQAIGLGVTDREITSFLMPVAQQIHPIYNPTRNYTVYLSPLFFFVLLQVLLLLVTVYALGSEGKFGTVDEWLRTANGHIGIAVIAKLFPYILLFVGMGLFANWVFYGMMHLPILGNWFLLNGITILFLCATQALALCLFAVFPALSIIISIVSMVGSLGATLSGITFPVSSMYMPVYIVSFLFPIRHYVEVFQTILCTEDGGIYIGTSVVWLIIYLLLPWFLLPHLKSALMSKKYECIE